MRLILGAAAAFLATGCTSVGEAHITQTLTFSFNTVRDNWVSGAADYPEAQAAAVGAFGAVQTLPAPLTSTISEIEPLTETNAQGMVRMNTGMNVVLE